MVGCEGETFSNHVVHYATSLRGTRQYKFKQRSWLIAMVDTLGLPTIFFTHSAAELQWPELACLICPDDPDSSSAHSKAVQEKPAMLTCSSTNASPNSLTPSTSDSLVQLTTGSTSSGCIVPALTSMALPGFLIQMWTWFSITRALLLLQRKNFFNMLTRS